MGHHEPHRRPKGCPAARLTPLAVRNRKEDDSDRFKGPDTVSDAGTRAQRLLEHLPERYRQILKLRFLDTLSVKEAAATMGVSVSGAKVLQYRALRMAAKTNASPQLTAESQP